MSKHSTSNRLQQLRNAMKNLTVVPEALRAYVVPTDDAHQNEYIAATDQRRAYISGTPFTGQARVKNLLNFRRLKTLVKEIV